MCNENNVPSFWVLFDLLGQTCPAFGRHIRGVDDSAGQGSSPVLQHGLGAVAPRARFSGTRLARRVQRQGFLFEKEIPPDHGGHFCFGLSLGPCAHRMGIRHGVFLDRIGCATVKLPLAQNRFTAEP